MRKTYVLCLFICGLIACNTQQASKLSLNQMKLLVWDLTIADNLYQQQQFKDSNLQRTNLQQQYYQKIFQSHQVRQADFLDTYNYYKQHPNLLKVLLDSVENFGNRQKTKRLDVK